MSSAVSGTFQTNCYLGNGAIHLLDVKNRRIQKTKCPVNISLLILSLLVFSLHVYLSCPLTFTIPLARSLSVSLSTALVNNNNKCSHTHSQNPLSNAFSNSKQGRQIRSRSVLSQPVSWVRIFGILLKKKMLRFLNHVTCPVIFVI